MSLPLLDRRLVFVAGKGGVGKSTVAAALGLAAVAAGKRVLLVEIEEESSIRPLLGIPSRPGDGGPQQLLPGLFRMSVGGRAALEEYLGLIIPIRRVLKAIFEAKVYQYFVAAAPGLRELMTVGKIWYEVDQARWDLVVVDCPATGHSLQYLRMPKAARDTFPSGLVHREAQRVWEVLCDPARTGLAVVTIAEEMPVNETLEICAQLEGDLGLPRGWLFVNRFHAPRLTSAEVERARALVARRSLGEERGLIETVLVRAAAEAGWGELHETYRRKLEAGSGWPLVVLPFVFGEEFRLADVEAMAAAIASASGAAPKRRERR